MQKQLRKHKRQARKAKTIRVDVEIQTNQIVMTSADTQTDLINQLFEDQEYALTTEVQDWKSIAAQYKNEIRRTEKRASTTIFGYVERMDVMRLRNEK